MEFYIKNIGHRLSANRKMYIFFAVEMIIGSMILAVCVNMILTKKNALETYERTHMGEKSAVTESSAVYGDSDEAPKLPLDLKSYEVVKEKYKDELCFAFSEIFYLDMFLAELGEAVSFQVYCMDNTYFNELFGKIPDLKEWENTAYIGSDALAVLERVRDEEQQQHSVFSTSEVFKVMDGSLFAGDKKMLKVQTVDSVNANGIEEIPFICWSGNESNPLATAVILPISYAAEMEEMHEQYSLLGFSMIKVGGMDGRADFAVLNKFTDELTKMGNGETIFRVEDKYLELERMYQGIDVVTRFWLLTGIFITMIVAVGITGVFMLLQYRRRKSIAVSFLCGSTRRRIHAELLSEICTVLLSGATVGNLLAFMIIKKGVVQIAEISWFAGSFWVIEGIAFLMSIFTFAIVWLYDRKNSFLTQIRQSA